MGVRLHDLGSAAGEEYDDPHQRQHRDESRTMAGRCSGFFP
jgi:hypothetical protein